MINLNVVARIAEDKNSFPQLLTALYKLKADNITNVNILFIGPIQSDKVYDQLIGQASELQITSSIAFTKMAIPIGSLPSEIRSGYFINFTIGDFIGYSAIDGIKQGLKTICLNVDKTLTREVGSSISNCGNEQELIGLIKKIAADKTSVDEEIIADNRKMLNNFHLDPDEEIMLLNILQPAL